MTMTALTSAVDHSVAAGAVRSTMRAGIRWNSARTADDLATDAWFSEVDDFIDAVPTNADCQAFLRFLVRIADDYVTCLAEAGGDPPAAATTLLTRKGVYLSRLLARMSQQETIALIAALGEFLTVLPDRLELTRLGATRGAAAAVGLIASDLIPAGNGSRHAQQRWRELFLMKSALPPGPIQPHPARLHRA